MTLSFEQINKLLISIKCKEFLDDPYNDSAVWNYLSHLLTYLLSCHLVNWLPTSTSITVAATAGRHAGWTTEGSWFHYLHGQEIYLFHKSSRTILGPPSFLLNGYREMNLTNHFQIVLSLIMGGAIPPLPPTPSLHFNFVSAINTRTITAVLVIRSAITQAGLSVS